MRIPLFVLRHIATHRRAGAPDGCITHDYGDGWVEVDTDHASYPRENRGLGDAVAKTLDAIGITKERAKAVASAVGIKDCGCKQRQQAMNDFGAKFLGLPAGEKPIDPP